MYCTEIVRPTSAGGGCSTADGLARVGAALDIDDNPKGGQITYGLVPRLRHGRRLQRPERAGREQHLRDRRRPGDRTHHADDSGRQQDARPHAEPVGHAVTRDSRAVRTRSGMAIDVFFPGTTAT